MSSISNILRVLFLTALTSMMVVACAKKGRKIPITDAKGKQDRSKAAKDAANNNKSTPDQIKKTDELEKDKEANKDNEFVDGDYELINYKVVISNDVESKTRFVLELKNNDLLDGDIIDKAKKNLILTKPAAGEDLPSTLGTLIPEAKKLIMAIKIPLKFTKESSRKGQESLEIKKSVPVVIGFNDDDLNNDSLLSGKDVLIKKLRTGRDLKSAVDLSDILSTPKDDKLTKGTRSSDKLIDADIVLISGEIDAVESQESDFSVLSAVASMQVKKENTVQIDLRLTDKDTLVDTNITLVYETKKVEDTKPDKKESDKK